MKTRTFTLGLLAVLMCFAGLQAAAQCCVTPANLTVKSVGRREADLQWKRVVQTGCITPVRYKVQYRVLGTATWTTVMVRTRKDDKFGDTMVSGLTLSTTYQWRVQGICSSTSRTAFVNGPNFTTLAAPVVTTSAVSSNSLQGNLTATVYPNPVGGEMNITGYLKVSGPVDVQLLNSMGQAVFHQSYNFSQGDFSTKIDVSKLHTGIYTMIACNKAERVSLTIVKE